MFAAFFLGARGIEVLGVSVGGDVKGGGKGEDHEVLCHGGGQDSFLSKPRKVYLITTDHSKWIPPLGMRMKGDHSRDVEAAKEEVDPMSEDKEEEDEKEEAANKNGENGGTNYFSI